MTTGQVRNASNTGWITLTDANTKIRNASNTGWISASASNLKVRDASNTGWLSPIGTSTPVISSMSAGSLATVMDVSPNGAHQVLSDGSTSYGLWVDGPPNPYKDASGYTYIPVPHSENYRFRVDSWDNGAGWVLQGPTLTSARNTLESAYNNRNWVYGHWSTGSTVYALLHHEWYYGTKSVDGIGGFNSGAYGFNKRWVNAISWASSSDGGATFSTSGATNSSRLVLVPEPWNVQQKDHMYGFFHPSNIVQEGSYYYACVEQRSLASGGTTVNTGMSLIRTSNLAAPTGWQFWDGSSWQTVDHNSYQGNASSQVPYRFFAVNGISIYDSGAYNAHMGQSLRYHTPTGQWVIFGYAGTTAAAFGYSTSPTLANPVFNVINSISTPNPSDYVTSGGKYISVFDPASSGNNFVNIGNSCVVLTTNNWSQIRKTTLTIT